MLVLLATVEEGQKCVSIERYTTSFNTALECKAIICSSTGVRIKLVQDPAILTPSTSSADCLNSIILLVNVVKDFKARHVKMKAVFQHRA